MSNVKISRKLTKVLRHSARELSIEITDDGYVAVNNLINHLNTNLSTIQDIVANDSKNRFTLKNINGILCIKANQGHSMDVCVDVELLVDGPECIIHGTFLDKLPLILSNGLSRMNRNHIHFCSGIPSNDSSIISGFRSSCQVLIYIDFKKASNDGIEFYKSENGVILSSGINGIIPKSCFLKVTDRNGVSIQY